MAPRVPGSWETALSLHAPAGLWSPLSLGSGESLLLLRPPTPSVGWKDAFLSALGSGGSAPLLVTHPLRVVEPDLFPVDVLLVVGVFYWH